MKLLNTTARNIMALVAVIALAGGMLWLVKGQTSPSSATQAAIPTLTLRPTDTLDLHSSKANTPTPTSTLPPMISLATPVLGPTYTPAPPIIPTATFEPLRGQAIGGYVFSEAQLVPDTLGSYIELVEWLPDDPNKILAIRDRKLLEVIDVNTGETHLYSGGEFSIRNPVWLSARQAVAYLTVNGQDSTQQHLWVSEDVKAISPIFTTTLMPPLMATQDGQGVILFDANWRLIQINDVNVPNQTTPLITETNQFSPSSIEHDQVYKSVSSSSRDKIIFHNAHNLLLTNVETKNIKHFPLQVFTDNGEQVYLKPQCVRWRPDGQALALTGQVDGNPVNSINYLYLVNLNTDEFQQIIHPFFYIQDIVWTPDGKNLVVSAVYDEKLVVVPVVSDKPFPTKVSGLFLINVATNEIQPLGIPDGNAQLGECQMRWDPDGTKIAFNYFDFAEDINTTALYIINVNRP